MRRLVLCALLGACGKPAATTHVADLYGSGDQLAVIKAPDRIFATRLEPPAGQAALSWTTWSERGLPVDVLGAQHNHLIAILTDEASYASARAPCPAASAMKLRFVKAESEVAIYVGCHGKELAVAGPDGVDRTAALATDALRDLAKELFPGPP